ncbi:hypothetical protein [uncultured Fibrobacter sp.]|uniref:hypothetical protein n=1 Tax=uncultured Fibrobacter sp. TaxID=261512 RepID=UPI0028064390|nr:hypothetical protein [uncultured Fibrobacter sp.]
MESSQTHALWNVPKSRFGIVPFVVPDEKRAAATISSLITLRQSVAALRQAQGPVVELAEGRSLNLSKGTRHSPLTADL